MYELREFFERLSLLLCIIGLPGSLLLGLLFWLMDCHLKVAHAQVLVLATAVLVFLWQVKCHAATLKYRRHRRQVFLQALEYATTVCLLLAVVFVWGDFLAHTHWSWTAGTMIVWLVYLHLDNV